MTRVPRRPVDLTLQATLVNERAAAKLAKRGLVGPRRPEISLPELPQNLTDLDDASLIGLFTEITGWADYAAVEMAKAAIDERALASALEVSSATAMVRGFDGEKVTIARAMRDLDDDVQELRQAAVEAYALRKLTETIFNNLERDAALVSRELTRRTAGQVPTKRADRYRP